MTIKYPAVVLKEVDSLVAVGSPQKSNAATFPREFVGIPPPDSCNICFHPVIPIAVQVSRSPRFSRGAMEFYAENVRFYFSAENLQRRKDVFASSLKSAAAITPVAPRGSYAYTNKGKMRKCSLVSILCSWF